VVKYLPEQPFEQFVWLAGTPAATPTTIDRPINTVSRRFLNCVVGHVGLREPVLDAAGLLAIPSHWLVTKPANRP
jgi:hypothetical protein